MLMDPLADLTLMKLLADGGPDFHRSHFASNSWTRHASKSCTADLHMDRPSVVAFPAEKV